MTTGSAHRYTAYDNDNDSDVKKSPSPPPQQHHRRGYQACDPCRKRKVKCDLGSRSFSFPASDEEKKKRC